jgi:hypothetical protein
MKRHIAIGLAILIAVSGADARTHRSAKAKVIFAYYHPCPSTNIAEPHCPGYVIDHVKPLACGGEDAPSNMQWQTIADGKAKDKWERKTCGGQ